MTAPNKMAKRAAAGTLALAVCFTGGLVAATTATAAPGFNFDTRLSGATRIDTAVDASKAAFPNANTVVVVNSDRFADGLTASYAAGIADDNAGAPILYVNEKGIPDQTRDEIKRLGAKNVIIVGGTAVVPQKVQDELDSFVDNVKRLSGKDRFETSAAVALSGSKDVGTVFIANGDATADALAAGPIAYRSHNPIVLVQKDSLPGAAKDALGQLKEERRIVVGGTAVVSEDTAKAADATSRIRGTNRQNTAIELAKYAIANEAGFNSGNVAIIGSQDRNAADALVAAPVAGKAGTPILFTEGDKLGADTAAYLQSIAGDLKGTGYIFGGTAAVPENVAGEAKSAAGGDAVTPSGISVTTDGKDIQQVSTTKSGEENRGSVTYTVATSAKSINIALWDATNVVTTDGAVTFKSGAKTTATTAAVAIESVNGAVAVTAGSGAAAQGVIVASPVNGKITFTVDAASAGNYVPVVWEDKAGGSTKGLDFDKAPSATTPQVPNETFGVGQAVRFIPSDKSDATAVTTALITFVNKQENYFTTATATFRYDDNDKFTIGGPNEVPRSLDYFEARLTVGDTISILAGGYAPTPAQVSTFDLTNGAPVALAAPSVEQKDTSAVVTFDPLDTTTGLVDGATVKVHLQDLTNPANPGSPLVADFDKSSVVASATKDADSAKALFQIPVSGLKANTKYGLWITQTVSDEESAPKAFDAGSGLNSFNTLKDVADLSVKSVGVTSDVNDGATPTGGVKGLAMVLSGKVVDASVGSFTKDDVKVYPTSQPTNVIPVATAVIGTSTDNDQLVITLGADGINDATTDVEYTVEIASNQLSPATDSTKVNAKLTGTFKH